jgi:PGF-pre-PGF domain-containing protein
MCRWYVVLALVLFILLIGSAEAYTTNECNSTISEDTTLNGSISNDDGNCFAIETNNTVFDCAGYTIDGDGDDTGYGIYVNASNVTIQHCNITEFSNGIDFQSPINNITIYNTTFDSNTHAIYTINSEGSHNLTELTITNSSNRGMYIEDCDYCILRDITSSLCSGSAGIDFETSSNALLTNIVSNSNIDGIYFVTVDNVTLTNVTASSNDDVGIWIWEMTDSTFNIITAHSNGGESGIGGIYLDGGNHNNTFTNMDLSNGGGVRVDTSNNNTFTNLTIINTSQAAVFVTAYDNNITESNLSSNNYTAINFTTTARNYISNNTICYNANAYTGTPSITDTIANNTFCVDLQSPPDSTSSTNTSYNFTAEYSNAINATNTTCTFYVDDYNESNSTLTTHWDNVTFNKTLSIGTYTWNISCLDNAGNSGTSANWDLTVDAAPVATTDTCNISITEDTTLNGSISNDDGDCFVITSNNIVFDCNGYFIDGDNDTSGKGIQINTNNVTIKNCPNITEFHTGIYILGDNSTIFNITANSNTHSGISIYNSQENNITNITVNSNALNGLIASGTKYNNITNIYASDNLYGIAMYSDSNYTEISSNILTANRYGIYLDAIGDNIIITNNNMFNNVFNFRLSYFTVSGASTHIIDTSNTVDNKQVYYLKGNKSETIDIDLFNVGLLFCANCENMTFRNAANQSYNGQAFYFINTTNSTISNVTAYSNDVTLYAKHCSGLNVTDVTAYDSYSVGINFEYINQSVITNVISNNSQNDGIDLTYADNITTTNLTIYSSGYIGNYNYMLTNSEFYNLNISSNLNVGLHIDADCYNLTFTNSDLSNNGYGGSEGNLYIDSSYNVTFNNLTSTNATYGVVLNSANDINITNSNISSNTARAIYLNSESRFNLLNTTICYNAVTFTGTPSITDEIANNTFCVDLQSPPDSTSSTNTSYNFTAEYSNAINVTNTTCTFYVDDYNESNSTLTTHWDNVTFNKTLSIGTYTWNISCLDNAGNSGNSGSRTLTITSASSGDDSSSSSGSGGGGGGGGNRVVLVTETKSTTFENMKKGKEVTSIINSELINIKEIVIIPSESKYLGTVSVNNHDSKPSTVSEPASKKVYQYLDIISNFDIDVATIKFEVDYSWLIDNDLNADNVILLHYNNGVWEDLPTVHLSGDDYESNTTSFSSFAISAKEEISIAPEDFKGKEDIESEINEKNIISKQVKNILYNSRGSKYIFSIVIILFIIFGLIIYVAKDKFHHKKRKHSKSAKNIEHYGFRVKKK